MKFIHVSKKNQLFMIMAVLACGSADAGINKEVVGTSSSGRLGSLDSATVQNLTQGLKENALQDAEQKCLSKVRQRTLFKTEVDSGQYGATHTYTVSADFECVSANESDALMTDATNYLLKSDAEQKTNPQYRPGLVRHFVSFQFKAGVTQAKIEEVKKRFAALKNLCVRNGRPYVVSIDNGDANSFEGADQGMKVGFIVTFRSEGDRNYYVGQPLINPQHTTLYDHAHLAFKNFVGPLLSSNNGAFVFDFTKEN